MKSHKTPPTNGISSIADIAKKYTTKIDLQKKILELVKLVGAQDETIETLTQELTKIKLNSESDSYASNDIQVYKNIPETEKLIADLQLSRLREAALGRDLTLEETRKFEIFSKIKNQDGGDKKPKDDSKLPRDVTPRTLLEIAGKDIKKPNE